MRLPGWEMRLAVAIEAARTRPFAWGRHDCATFAFELRCALTGLDGAAPWRGRYRTEIGARRAMRRLGWETLEQAGRDLLGAPLPTPLLARRGDIVLSADRRAAGVCLGARTAFVGPGGLVFDALRASALAWAI